MTDRQPDEGHHLVAVHGANTDGEAEVVLALLRAHGIDAYEANRLPHSVYPVVGDGQIFVHEDDAEAAQRILAERPDPASLENPDNTGE
jgi:hypothetical protein